jgi:hypothetical protein
VIVLFGRETGWNKPQAARHAEMDQQVAMAEIEQKVFSATFDRCKPGSTQDACQVRGQRIAQCRCPGDHPGYAVSGQGRSDAAAGYFHLGQFRHAVTRTKG